MTKILLITRTNHDDTTFYSCEWAKEVIKVAKDADFKIKDIKGKNVTRKNVVSFLKKQNPRLVFFYGHGSDDSVNGYGGEVLIKVNENDRLLKGKIIHSLTCNSAKTLGPKSVEKGAEAYIGYKDEFVFFWDKDMAAHPTRDEIAKPFFDSANKTPISLLNGKTVEEAVRKTRLAYNYWIAYYRLHGELLEASQNLIGLIWNKINFVVHGNLNTMA